MPHQLDFDFGDELVQTTSPPRVDGATLDERFAAFHELNPHVYRAIVNLARRFHRMGKTHGSMKLIFEMLRGIFLLRTQGDEQFQLNNSYTSRYARLVMQQERDLAEFFEVRALAEERHG